MDKTCIWDTIKDLYSPVSGTKDYERLTMFVVLTHLFPELSWKSRNNEYGEPFEVYFTVGIDTPDGPFIYRLSDSSWDMFDCKEIERAKLDDKKFDAQFGRCGRLISLIPDDEETVESKLLKLSSTGYKLTSKE